jgi:hypothetical protein
VSKHSALKAFVGEDKDKRRDKRGTLCDKERLLNASAAVLRANKAPRTIRQDGIRGG